MQSRQQSDETSGEGGGVGGEKEEMEGKRRETESEKGEKKECTMMCERTARSPLPHILHLSLSHTHLDRMVKERY